MCRPNRVYKLILLITLCAALTAAAAAVSPATQAEAVAAAQSTGVVASGTCGENLTWSLNSTGVLEISGSGAMTDYKINADSTTAPWKNYASSIRSVVFEFGISSIGRHAFYKFQDLKSIRFPNDNFSRLSTIGEGAFECTGLTGTLSLPDKVTVIEGAAFSECVDLTRLSLPSGLTSIGPLAFCNCTGLTGALTFPRGLVSIGNKAFQGCYNMTGPLTFPASLTSIGSDAFEDCSGFGRLAFFEGNAPSATTTSLRNGTRVYYRPEASGWKDSGAYDSTTETWNGYPLNVWNRDDALASGTCGKELTWSLSADGVLTVSGSGRMKDYSRTNDRTTMTAPWSDFSGAIRKVIVEPGVTSIGECAFYNCKSITDISLPDGLTGIGFEAFYGCTALAGDLIFPDSLTSIGSAAFYDCTGLTGTLIFPASLTEILPSAFLGCTGLDKLVLFLGNAPQETEQVFVSGTTVYYRSGTSGWPSDSGWCGYPLKEVPGDTVAIGLCGAEEGGEDLIWRLGQDGTLTVSGSGAMANYSGTTATPWSRYSGSIYKVKVESGVTSIGSHAFDGFAAMTDVSLPDSLTSIGIRAFMNCTALSGELVLPDGVRTIAEESFCGCSGLTGTLRIPSGVSEIRSGAFMGCTGLSKLILPDTISTIRDCAFYECTGLSELILPRPLFSATIEEAAFFGCTGLRGTLTIPKNVCLQGGAFAGCTGITAFAAEDYYFVDDSGALYEDSTLCAFPAGAPLETYTVRDRTSIIGRSAFSGCRDLDTVIVPATVQRIDENAFGHMLQLRSVYFYGDFPQTRFTYFPQNDDSRLKICYMENTDGWTEENWPSQYFELIEWDLHRAIGVALDAQTLTLEPDESQKLIATVLALAEPEKTAVTWASADADVAAVSADGMVLGKKAGTTTITATTVDGGFTASCTVTVKAVVTVSLGSYGQATLSACRPMTGQIYIASYTSEGRMLGVSIQDAASALNVSPVSGAACVKLLWLDDGHPVCAAQRVPL